MTSHRVLISGAGIAGSTAAYWLARYGWCVSMVEFSSGTRSSGAPVDVRAEALQIVSAMGLLPDLRAAATTAARTMIINSRGVAIAQLAAQNSVARGTSLAEVEVARPELARILLSSVGDVELRTDDSIAAMEQDATGVDVTFDSGLQRRFDLVIGADGMPISRIALPRWWYGRIALVGDAASAASLLSNGSTRAIIGARTLARELTATDDHAVALRRYQQAHQSRTAKAWQVRLAARLLVPATALGISSRNRVLQAAGLRERALRTLTPA